MSKEMICPFCGEEILYDNYYTSCKNPKCAETIEMSGTEELWQALIQSQRDLQTAVQALKDIQTAQGRHWGATDTDIKTDCKYYARKALEQIEHKE